MIRPSTTLIFVMCALLALPGFLSAHAGCNGCSGHSSGKTTERSSSKSRERAHSYSPKTKIAKKSGGKKSNSWWSRKTLSTMNYQELKEAKERYIQAKNIPSAIKFLERMVKECTDLNERRSLMLELADLQFETEKYDQAGLIYQEFIKYYSGSDKVEYASYKAIVCSYQYIADLDRDQSKTIETIELAQAFLDRAQIFTTYQEQVQSIFTACMERLFESELCIAEFYVNRGRYASAFKRFETIRKNFMERIPAAEAQILTRECSLAEKIKDPALISIKQAELKQKFPEVSMTLAHNTKDKQRSFANRF